jgi:Uma2 family endonuclease
MAYIIPALTVDDLDQFPDDGMRREIIDGELYVGAAPSKEHQELSKRLLRILDRLAEATGWGKVYYSPVDVYLSEESQVQPDLLLLRRERLDLYRGNKVYGAPDIIVEILSPSNRSYDLVEKAHLYAKAGVPEYWVADPLAPSFQMLALVDGQYVPVEPDADGIFHSTVVPGLTVDPAVIFTEPGF